MITRQSTISYCFLKYITYDFRIYSNKPSNNFLSHMQPHGRAITDIRITTTRADYFGFTSRPTWFSPENRIVCVRCPPPPFSPLRRLMGALRKSTGNLVVTIKMACGKENGNSHYVLYEKIIAISRRNYLLV